MVLITRWSLKIQHQQDGGTVLKILPPEFCKAYLVHELPVFLRVSESSGSSRAQSHHNTACQGGHIQYAAGGECLSITQRIS